MADINKIQVPGITDPLVIKDDSGTKSEHTHTSNQLTDASKEGNRGANTVVLAADNGQINTEKLALTIGTTVKAVMQYNSSENCIEFKFV